MDKHKLTRVAALLDRVYSPYSGPSWRPKAFAGRSRRYLWSDAFGVCNYITLYYAHNKAPQYLDQADALIQDVHETLGRYRDSTQWLGQASAAQPTLGGLRIGKEDEQDDGQYFHYLTKWMFALNRMSIARNDVKYNEQAIALAQVAHRQFVIHGLGGRALRMVWKISVDLQHVLVSNEGNLDPIDGYVTYRLLQQHASASKNQVLTNEINDMRHLMERKLASFTSSDELDSGEAIWLSQWAQDESWALAVQQIALNSIEFMFQTGVFARDARYRLMFREMGTVLGIQVAIRQSHPRYKLWNQRMQSLLNFWEERVFDRDADISPLMYASALVPGVWDPHIKLQ